MSLEMLLQSALVVTLYLWFCHRASAIYELLSLWVEVTKSFIKGEYEQ